MSAIDEVLETDRERIRAMLGKDIDALGRLLADDLVFTHPDGRKDNRESLINAMLAGAAAYRQIDVRMTDTRDFGGTAVLIGEADMTVSSYGQRSSFEVRFTAVYVQRAAGWQLAVWQATRRSA